MKIRRENSRGAAAVEFAIVATLLVTLLIGIVEFGIVFFVQGTLAGAAREASRDFAINGNQAHATAVALAAAPGTGLVASEVQYNLGTCPAGQSGRVTIRHTHHFLTGFLTPVVGATIQLDSTGTMRCKG